MIQVMIRMRLASVLLVGFVTAALACVDGGVGGRAGPAETGARRRRAAAAAQRTGRAGSPRRLRWKRRGGLDGRRRLRRRAATSGGSAGGTGGAATGVGGATGTGGARGTGGVDATGGAGGNSDPCGPSNPATVPLPTIPRRHVRHHDLRRQGRRQDRQHHGDPDGAQRRQHRRRRTVSIPSGTFLSGPIVIHSSTRLRFRLGLRAADAARSGYPSAAPAFITTDASAHDIALTGAGTIDGQGQAWWDAFATNSALARPQEVNLGHVTRIQISGIRLAEPARGAHLGQERHQRHDHRHHHQHAGRVREVPAQEHRRRRRHRDRHVLLQQQHRGRRRQHRHVGHEPLHRVLDLRRRPRLLDRQHHPERRLRT